MVSQLAPRSKDSRNSSKSNATECTIEKYIKVTHTIGMVESLHCNGSQAHSKWLICPDGL